MPEGEKTDQHKVQFSTSSVSWNGFRRYFLLKYSVFTDLMKDGDQERDETRSVLFMQTYVGFHEQFLSFIVKIGGLSHARYHYFLPRNRWE